VTLHRLESMFPAELEAQRRARPLLVMPVGTIEWHSHHLPVGLDGLVGAGVAERIAEAAGAVLAPTTWWAVGGVPYPWTLNLPATLIEPLLTALFEQFGAMGFRVIVAFTGHFGRDHTAALKRAACAAMDRSPVTILPLTPYELITEQYTGDHAGPGEASMLWALDPDLVRLDAVPPSDPLPGVIGDDPRGRASQAWGEALVSALATRAAGLAELLLAAADTERATYLAALRASAAVFDAINQLRSAQPPVPVPPLMTPSWLAFCQAFAAADFAAARTHAEQRLTNLWT